MTSLEPGLYCDRETDHVWRLLGAAGMVVVVEDEWGERRVCSRIQWEVDNLEPVSRSDTGVR